jgi:hypothetical protein
VIYLMFIIGLLPIILAFLLLGVLIGRVAKKRGKNPWLWGATSVLLIVALTWKQLPTWAAQIYYEGMVAMQSVMPKEPVTTLAEANKINIASSVDGVAFDVPLTYHFRGYDQKEHGWTDVSKGQIAGTERPVVDYIHIVALVPDLAPMNEENLADFEVPGWGKTVMVSLTHIMQPWDHYFKDVLPNAEKRPESPEVLGMLHYYQTEIGSSDIYLSNGYATPDLTMITCRDQKVDPVPSPSCQIETSYYPPPAVLASLHKEGAIFRLKYEFSSQYLSRWRDIDKKLKSLFDQFVLNAMQRSSTPP